MVPATIIANQLSPMRLHDHTALFCCELDQVIPDHRERKWWWLRRAPRP